MTTELAITVVGRDRPGIIADVAEVLAGLGLNLTDSTMTLLRGHFAMTLVCAGPAPAGTVERALAPLAGDLTVTVEAVDPAPAADRGPGYVLTVHGGDRLGIVAATTRLVAGAGGTITDLTTRLTGDLYLLVAEVDLPSTVDVDRLGRGLAEAAVRLGVEAALRPIEADLL